jgi:hypothetical protein
MLKTIHQEVAEYLEGRAKALENTAVKFREELNSVPAEVRELVAREFRALSSHIFTHIVNRGLAVPNDEEKPADVS